MAPIYQFELGKEPVEEFKKLGYNPLEVKSKTEQIADLDRSDWIAFPEEFMSGKYVGTFMNPARLSYNSATEKVGKALEINYKNTSKDSMERDFIGSNNWSQFLKMNLLLGQETPTTKEQLDFLNLLHQGANGEIDVYTKAGKKLETKYLKAVFDDMVKVQTPWRAEYNEDNFTFKYKESKINNSYVMNEAGILVPNYSEVLDKNTLLKDKEISLTSLIKNPTEQGLAKKDIELGNFNFRCPRSDNNLVAWFDAFGYGAYLICNGNPRDRNSILGVRGVSHE